MKNVFYFYLKIEGTFWPTQCLLRDLLPGISLHDCEALLSRSEICGAGQQNGNSCAGADAAVKRKHFFLRGTSVLLLRLFN